VGSGHFDLLILIKSSKVVLWTGVGKDENSTLSLKNVKIVTNFCQKNIIILH